MSVGIRYALATIIALFSAYSLNAQVPGTISYQGLLDESLGSWPGTVNVTFRIYSSESGGTVLWTESHQNVPVSASGVFSLLVGSSRALDLPFDRAYWMEIAVGSSVMSPRTQLAASPYALRAREAQSVANNSITPEHLADGGTTPANNQVAVFDAANQRFKWITIGGGDSPIVALQEGSGIDIDEAAGPLPTISIEAEGVVDSMLADAAVTDRAIAEGTITGVRIKDSTITMEKFSPDVSIPLGGSAGGDLEGIYPNPSIAPGAVETAHIAANAVVGTKIAAKEITANHIADTTITGNHIWAGSALSIRRATLTSDLVVPNISSAEVQVSTELTVGNTTTSATPRVTIVGSGTGTDIGLEVRDNTGSATFVVQDNGNVGVGVAAPTARLQIDAPGQRGLQVVSGGTALSFGTVAAGAVILIPANTSVVQISSDVAPGSPNAVTMPAVAAPGTLLILINDDNDATAGGAVIAAGSAGIYVATGPPVPAWRRIN